MASQEDINHQQSLLSIYRRNLSILLAQSAHFGGEDAAPLHIINSIQESRDNIRRIKKNLRDWQSNVADHVDDEPADTAASSASA